MKKILVTGGNGMLATALRNVCIHDNNFIFADRSTFDITSPESIKAFLMRQNIGTIINCAAYTNVELAETEFETAYLINETGIKNIAMAAEAGGIFVIHISTDAVFDGTKNGIYFEDDYCNPLSVYSKSKYAGERALQENHNSGLIIRTSWLYSQDKNCFVTAIQNRAKKVGTLSVVIDQIGTPTYAYDLAKAILKIVYSDSLLTKNKIEIYHYSNQGAISWYDFAVNICELSNIDANIKAIRAIEYPSKVSRPFQTVLSKSKIETHFNISIPYWRTSLIECVNNLI